MSVKTADTIAQLTHLLSDYPKLILFYCHQSTAPADKLSLFGELARRIPSYQFSCIDLDRTKAIETLPYFTNNHGIVVFVDGDMKTQFAGENNKFYLFMDDMDKESLDKLIGFDEESKDEVELGRIVSRIVSRRVESICKQEKKKSFEVRVSVTLDA
ncbi:hypothetical protein H4R99_002057 [Coemansia sp. RSA 1722]|nr:hypothetical protein LPJ57_000831 [Coemansia sp. RSA 486]KAJ2236678.1 hypothetical protein IWW45_001592 [Coemansia sp. RSA 485]KAJ2599569.1 hypothetical protein GGF39_002167 [Coemansia sp. RSA 1721]KAJ2604039.1 hypothetical protein H4R99_002057 [Coemansia sp. RSA 1722]KAJ2637944.1 hypothetical protein GGF40_002015 [Coemansia sp. RSA 1286]